MKSLLTHLSGEVQGVGLRASIRNKAQQLDLVGWVKNNPDATLSALIQGEEKNIQQFLSWLETGEYSSLIQHKHITEQTPDPTLKTFEIHY